MTTFWNNFTCMNNLSTPDIIAPEVDAISSGIFVYKNEKERRYKKN